MSKKVTENTGLVVSGQYKQSDIPSLLEVLNGKIAALKGDKEKNARVTGELEQFGKISSITDVNQLRAAYAYVTHKEEAIKKFDDVFKKAAPGVKLPVMKEGGSTPEQWREEILIQYKEISFQEELSKLEKAKTILQNNLSEEMKLAASLQDVAELLKMD